MLTSSARITALSTNMLQQTKGHTRAVNLATTQVHGGDKVQT